MTDYIVFIHGVNTRDVRENPHYADPLFTRIQDEIGSEISLKSIPLYWGDINLPEEQELLKTHQRSPYWSQLGFKDFREKQLLQFTCDVALYISRNTGSAVVDVFRDQLSRGWLAISLKQIVFILSRIVWELSSSLISFLAAVGMLARQIPIMEQSKSVTSSLGYPLMIVKADKKLLCFHGSPRSFDDLILPNTSGRLYPNISDKLLALRSKSERLHEVIEKHPWNLNGVAFSGRHRKKGGGPEMLANECKRIGKGGQGFGVPGRLANGKRLSIQQLLSKNGDERKQAQQRRCRVGSRTRTQRIATGGMGD